MVDVELDELGLRDNRRARFVHRRVGAPSLAFVAAVVEEAAGMGQPNQRSQPDQRHVGLAKESQLL